MGASQLLWEDGDRALYRERRSGDITALHSTLALRLTTDRPTPASVDRLAHEYELKDYLENIYAARPLELIRGHSQTELILEDPGGEPLDTYLGKPLDTSRFLRIAFSIAACLRQVHQRGLLHRDLKPAHILVDDACGQARLTGFGLALRLPRDRPLPGPPEFIAGTLAYMAPEQTGRMNRSVDSRCDLYALGVIFYEMLTGQLPFAASNPTEWIHCHVAKHALPPHERVESVPPCVSAIVMKLLAKTPEERYRTAAGVENDLQRCLVELEAHGVISNFVPGRNDAPDRLLIPERLYGRDREVGILQASLDRVVAGGRPELVLISGYSGIGKSALVNELPKQLVPLGGLFASGKFDQYKRDIPYSTLAQSFQDLTRQLLSKAEAELREWQNALREALGADAHLMVDLVPELKAIIGDQSPVLELHPGDAKRRFHLAFRRFIEVFARPEHPLVLFLDDLQWSDAATLDLLEDLLAQPDTMHLMLIAAYRDNEIDAAHPLGQKLDAVRQAGALLQDVVLAPLRPEDLALMVADALRCDPREVRQLAQLVHEKTGGNPFFAIQFISALSDERLLAFDHAKERWSWDIERIHAKGYTDNVVDLVVAKLTCLSPESQDALKQLACLGSAAEFTILCAVSQLSREEALAQFADAAEAGFVFRSKDSVHFLHDRVREAAYSLIPQESRAAEHLRIGLMMSALVPPKKLEEEIFDIVGHLNHGHHLVTSIAERERIAALNLVAGRRAKSTIAYSSALKYFHEARKLLTDEAWSHNYDLVFSVECLLAECELLSRDMSSAERRLSLLAAQAKTAHDVALVTRLHLTLYHALNRNDRAVEVFLEYWNGRGAQWSSHPSEGDVSQEYDRIWSLLGDRQIEELVDLPLMANSEVLDQLDVLIEIVTPAMYTDTRLVALVICRMVSLSLEHGNSDASCYAYVCLGVLTGPYFGDYPAGFRFGKLGCDVVERHGLHRFQPRTFDSFGTLIIPWTKHIRTGREIIRRAFDAANRTGDLTYAAYACNHLNTNLLVAGDPLSEAQRQAETGLAFATDTRSGLVTDIISAQLGLIRTLRGVTGKFGSLDIARFGELEFERHLAGSAGSALPECWYWILKVQARFFAGDYACAIEASLNAERLLWTSPSFFEVAEFHFYTALARAASVDTTTNGSSQRHLEALTAHQAQHDAWALNCPANFENRAALIAAEVARIEERDNDAMRLYERAIESSRANSFVQNEALANELAGRYYAARGFEKIANTYLRDAHDCYLRWGAEGKVRQLESLYPHLENQRSVPDPTSTIFAPVEHLDLATMIEVSQTISRETVLETLIESLMGAALEQAGAERGLLLLANGAKQRIAAEATTRDDALTVCLRDEPVAATALPESIVRYVLRTRESVIVEDAGQSMFGADPYVQEHQLRSVLCLPLLNRANVIGVLFLENNLAPGVFAPAQTAVLKLLASQAAISLQNAQLYRDLAAREAKIRRLVDSDIIGIVIWDLDGRLIDANDAFLRMIQYERNDLQAGLRWFDMTPPEWQEVHARYEAEELKATGIMRPREKEYFRKDGSRVPVLIGAASFEGQPDQGVAYILDLSNLKRAEDALRARERELSLLVDVVPSHLWRLAPDGEPVFFNKRMSDFLGLTVADLEKPGMSRLDGVIEAIHPEDAAEFRKRLNRCLATGDSFYMRYRLRRNDGVYRWMSSRAEPMREVDGRITQWYGLCHDIDDQIHAQEALVRAQDELRLSQERMTRASEAARLSELSASIAHEINQPLAAIVTNSQACHRWLSADPPNIERAKITAERITRDGNAAADVIGRIRALFHREVQARSSENVNRIVGEVCQLLAAEIGANNVHVKLDLEPDLPPVVMDRVQVQQVLINLMRNGIEAMEAVGDRARELEFRSRRDGHDAIRLEVRDAGAGFAEFERAFEPFCTTKPQGMGMGLAICRSIIEAHGGRIWVANNEVCGATVAFTLPLTASRES